MNKNKLRKIFEHATNYPVETTMIAASIVMAATMAFSDDKPNSRNPCKDAPANQFCIGTPYASAGVRG